MYPRLLHLYGPIWIHSYGFMLALGLALAAYLAHQHPLRKKYLTSHQFINMVFYGSLFGVIGGRLYVLVTEWDAFKGNYLEIFFPWVGGLGIVGSIVSAMITLTIFFKWNNIPALPALDLVAMYGSLAHAIARIGCFLTGCCFGIQAPGLWCAVTYTNPECSAPLYVPLHPAQLYTAALLLGVFILLRFGVSKWTARPGVVFWTYLICEGSIRFVSDWWRGDIVTNGSILTSAQWGGIILIAIAVCGWLYGLMTKSPR